MWKGDLKLILGGPGCGKTTRLLDIVDSELASGVHPSRIAFVAFTRAAANEARERAAEKFGIDADDLIWFRTIHSLVYKQLGMARSEVVDRKDWKDFSKLIGFNVTGYYSAEDLGSSIDNGDHLLRINDFARTTMMPLEEAWHMLDEGVDFRVLTYFSKAFERFKLDIAKMDFTDMLLYYIDKGEGVGVDVDVAVIDEAQDLTAAQWRVVEKAFRGAKRIYVGGDDDQAIYRWAGADIDKFLHLSKNPEILPISHRLPKSIHSMGSNIASRISKRYKKKFKSTGKKGHIDYHQDVEFVPFSLEGTWLVLARNNYLLREATSLVRDLGYNYRTRTGNAASIDHIRAIQLWESIRSGKREGNGLMPEEVKRLSKVLDLPLPQMRHTQTYDVKKDFGWPTHVIWHKVMHGISSDDREWYIACLRRGEKLQRDPRIRIETIHGVKGAEADNVLLITDMSARTQYGYRLNPDNEHRVFYVGVTRARKSLHVIVPQTDRFYSIGGGSM